MNAHRAALPAPGDDPASLDEQVALLRRLIEKGEARRLGRMTDVKVRSVTFDGDRLVAKVEGSTGTYETRITFFPRPGHRCTCPDWVQNGVRVGPCKHVLKLADLWWERVYHRFVELEYAKTAVRVATAHERAVVSERVAAVRRRADAAVTTGEGPEVLLVDLLDLLDLEYRDLYGRAATREDAQAILQSAPDEDWPRNVWLDAVKEAFGVEDDDVLDLADEDIDRLRDLWYAYEEADEAGEDVDQAFDLFFDFAEQVLREEPAPRRVLGKVTGDGSVVGFFFPLPEDLAAQYPPLGPEDTSPPHVTLLFVGEVPNNRKAEFVEVARAALTKESGPVWVTLGEPDFFVHADKDRRVWYSRVWFSKDVATIRDRLWAALVEAGFEVRHSYPLAYVPHVTLAYQLGATDVSPWDGPVPKGSWSASSVVVWGFSQVVELPLGRYVGGSS